MHWCGTYLPKSSNVKTTVCSTSPQVMKQPNCQNTCWHCMFVQTTDTVKLHIWYVKFLCFIRSRIYFFIFLVLVRFRHKKTHLEDILFCQHTQGWKQVLKKKSTCRLILNSGLLLAAHLALVSRLNCCLLLQMRMRAHINLMWSQLRHFRNVDMKRTNVTYPWFAEM